MGVRACSAFLNRAFAVCNSVQNSQTRFDSFTDIADNSFPRDPRLSRSGWFPHRLGATFNGRFSLKPDAKATVWLARELTNPTPKKDNLPAYLPQLVSLQETKG